MSDQTPKPKPKRQYDYVYIPVQPATKVLFRKLLREFPCEGRAGLRSSDWLVHKLVTEELERRGTGIKKEQTDDD